MVKYQSASLDATFAALADPTRREILSRLSRGEFCVTELAEPHDMSLPAITKHLGILEDAGLVTSEKEGRVRRCRLNPRPMKQASEWIAQYEEFWEMRLDALAKYLNETKRKDK